MSIDHATKEIKDLMIGLSLIEKRTIAEVAKIETFWDEYKLQIYKHEKSIRDRQIHYSEQIKLLLKLIEEHNKIVEKQNKKIESLEEQIKQLRKTTKEK